MTIKGNKRSPPIYKIKSEFLSLKTDKTCYLSLEKQCKCTQNLIYASCILSTKTFTSKLLNIEDYKFAESEEPQLFV